MMPVIHGIVNNNAVDRFEVQASSFVVGDSLSYDIYANIGNIIRTDYGDGNEVLTTITTTPQTILNNTVSTVNMTIRSNGNVSRIIFNSATNNYDTIDLGISSTLTNAESMCENLSNLTSFNINDASGITSFLITWRGCSSLTSFPLIDTSSVTDFFGAWTNCTSLASFPLLNTSAGTSFGSAWLNCTSLTSFPLIDTSLSNRFSDAWRNCTGLTSFPLIDTSSGNNFTDAWRDCTGLTSFPLIDTSSGDNFNGIWQGCTLLVCISSVNTLLQMFTFDMFLNTPALTNPNATEQTAILAGSNYINAGACP